MAETMECPWCEEAVQVVDGRLMEHEWPAQGKTPALRCSASNSTPEDAHELCSCGERTLSRKENC